MCLLQLSQARASPFSLFGYALDTPNKTLFLLCLKQLRLVSVPCNQSPDQLKYQSGDVEGVMGAEEGRSVTEWISGSLD